MKFRWDSQYHFLKMTAIVQTKGAFGWEIGTANGRLGLQFLSLVRGLSVTDEMNFSLIWTARSKLIHLVSRP